MKDDQHAHRREAYGVRGSSTSRSDSLCQSSMSRGEGTRMASHRAFTAGATTIPAAQGPGTCASTRDATPASRGQGLTRAALYARVSTDKQEREETIASQVDLLQQTAQARGYEPMVLVAYKLMSPIVLVGLIVTAIYFLHAGRKRATLPGAEESMTTTIEFITALFCQVDDRLSGLPKHPEAHLWPSEVVTLGLHLSPYRRAA